MAYSKSTITFQHSEIHHLQGVFQYFMVHFISNREYFKNNKVQINISGCIPLYTKCISKKTKCIWIVDGAIHHLQGAFQKKYGVIAYLMVDFIKTWFKPLLSRVFKKYKKLYQINDEGFQKGDDDILSHKLQNSQCFRTLSNLTPLFDNYLINFL